MDNKKNKKDRKPSIITLSILVILILSIIVFIAINVLTKDTLLSIKKVGDLELSNTSISKNGGLSWITADVYNKGNTQENIKINISFLNENGEELVNFDATISKIEKDSQYKLKSGITKDLSDVVNVKYKIVE